MMSADSWREVGLFDLVTIGSGQVDPRLPQYRNLPLIAPDHIESDTGRLIEIKTAAEQRAISGKYLVEPGDIIYSKIRPYLKKAYLAEFKSLCSADMYPLRPKGGVSSEYVLNVILGEQFTSFANSTSMRSGIPKLNRAELAEYRLLAPGSEDQKIIGRVLVQTDRLTFKLESLLLKKRAVKQGMMQELLTGQTRLLGFTDVWNTVQLGVIGRTYGGLTGKSAGDFRGGDRRFVTFMDVMSNLQIDGSRLAPVQVRTGERQNMVSVGDILLNGSSETPDELAMAAVVTDQVPAGTYLNSFCFGYRLASDSGVDPTFLAYTLRSDVGRRVLQASAQGATRYNLSKRQFLAITLSLPAYPEQQAIAQVLRDADSEIALLERRLESTSNIKKGLMQELLTGRTRLVSAEVTE